MATASPLAEALSRRTRAAAPELVERLPDGRLRCFACGHRCPIPEGREGVCRVRFNEGGTLRVPWGYVGGAAVRPDREEAVLPRAAGLRRAVVRDARLRPALRATARTGSRRSRCATRRRSVSRATSSRRALADAGAASWRADRRLDLQRAAHHLRMGRRGLPRGAAPRALRRRYVSNGNGTPRGARLHPAVGRLLQGRPEVDSTTSTTASSAACSTTCSRPSSGSTSEGFWLEIVTLIDPGLQRRGGRAAQGGARSSPSSRATSRGT